VDHPPPPPVSSKRAHSAPPPRLLTREHAAIMSFVAPGLAVAMFAAASRAHMAPIALGALIVLAGVVFCLAEGLLNSPARCLARGMLSTTVFCGTLMCALWFTTGHPGVLMWVVLTTSTCAALTTITGRTLRGR